MVNKYVAGFNCPDEHSERINFGGFCFCVLRLRVFASFEATNCSFVQNESFFICQILRCLVKHTHFFPKRRFLKMKNFTFFFFGKYCRRKENYFSIN